MTDDYTPTTEEVRNSYVENSARARKIRDEQFRRWLRKVKADVWEEAVISVQYDEILGGLDYPLNPYRKGE